MYNNDLQENNWFKNCYLMCCVQDEITQNDIYNVIIEDYESRKSFMRETYNKKNN